MDISVVIPFYNGEEFFEETLHSILSQTASIGEIIVVNDGCGEKAMKFLAQFKSITIINSPINLGISSARNLGIKRAKNNWIAFCDADDIWEPNKIELQINFITQYPQFSACHTGTTTFDNKGIVATFIDKPFDLTLTDLLESRQVTPPSLIITKAALESVNFFDQKIRCSEDHELSIRLVQQGFKIGFINKALTRVRRMDHDNISSNGRTILIGNYQLLKKHWHTFREHKGLTSRYIYRALMTAGGKSSGLEKRSYFLLGLVIAFAFRIKN